MSATPRLLLHGVRLKSGHVLNARIDGGVHAFLGDVRDPLGEVTLHELASLLSGWSAPRRGSVRIDGRAPHDHPSTRQRIASVLGAEPPLLGRTVEEHLARVGSLRGDPAGAGFSFLEGWRRRPAESLDGAERRTLAAAVAFTAPDPLLVVLHEPTRLGSPFDEQTILTRIHRWHEEGVTVVCTTTDPRLATRLGARGWSLAQGGPDEALDAEYLVRSDAARRLAARLADHPAVVALRYEEGLPRDLWLRGNSPSDLSEAILASVLAEKCELYEMTRLRRTSTLNPKAGEPGRLQP